MSLFGRRTIYTSTKNLTEENIITEVNRALSYHFMNLSEEEYLYWYRRGMQPILSREKEVRPEICNKVVENHAEEIVSFKDGYFLTQPAFYVARNEKASESVKMLNEYLYRSGKQQADNEIVDWFHTVGKGVCYICSNPNREERKEIPAKAYSLDPRCAFVVYSLEAGNEPVYAVNMSVDQDKLEVKVITKERIFDLRGGFVGYTKVTDDPVRQGTVFAIDKIETNLLGCINIIEYQYNATNMGAFESVVPLLDAINTTMSNRVDGIEQFIQSLLIFYNCTLGKDEDGNDITPEYVRKAGALFLQNVGENKADLKEISSQLNQTETQVLVDYMYQQVLTICGMPSTTKGGASTSDTGSAVLARDGWYQADTFARNTEDYFKKSNRRFDEVFIKLLNLNANFDIKLSDFELQFVRNETSNVQSKAQACKTLLASGFNPELAFAKSGISNDPVTDVEMSRKYLNMIWGNPDGEKGEAKIVERTNEV